MSFDSTIGKITGPKSNSNKHKSTWPTNPSIYTTNKKRHTNNIYQTHLVKLCPAKKLNTIIVSCRKPNGKIVSRKKSHGKIVIHKKSHDKSDCKILTFLYI